MFFKFAPFRAPKSFKFQDPDTGFKYEARTMQELLSHIRGYRKQNGLSELEFLETVVESYLCTLPENLGGCTPVPKLKRGLFASIRGGIALLENVMYTRFVPQEEADSRADICEQCPHNVFPDKTGFIRWSDELAQASVGEKKVKNYDQLGNCEICSCPLRAKVWYAGKLDLSDKEIQSFPDFCWQKTLALQERK